MSTPTSRVIPRVMATLAVALATVGLTAVHAGLAPAHAEPDPAPLLGRAAPGAIEGQYIVVMKEQTTASAARSARAAAVRDGGKVMHGYSSALRGFSARLPEKALAGLRHNPNVDYIEADQRVTLSAEQPDPTWGLDRIDQRNRPLDSNYHYDRTGSGVLAYIVDTGILTSHGEFSGRTAGGYSAISDGRGTTDCNGHGTHVAGTVGGTEYGVAKAVTLIPVRVLNCQGSGTNSGVIAGIDWVTTNHTSGPAVANMSLGGGASSAVDSAVTNSINDGVTYAVAAGNESSNACNGSPSRVGPALTVGATTSSDARASYSNYGSCLDLFAPGSSITSAWHTSTAATNTISGTSMATPHVAGVAALYLQANPGASPSSVASAIVNSATTGKVTSPGTGSPNRLLYSLFGTSTEPPPPSGNLLGNPGFEAGNTEWTASSGVITRSTGRPARSGSWKAWLNGYGRSSTDTLSQGVTLPSSGTKTLSFWIRIDSAETTSSTAYDRLRVQVVSGGTTTTLATYSNLNESGYVQRSFSLAAYAGRAITVRFVGTEDSSLQTSFVIDDTAIG